MQIKIFFQAAIYLTFLFISWHAVADTCNVIEAAVIQDQVIIPANESGHKIIGSGRAYIYSVPNETCRNDNLFLVPGDLLNAYAEYENFIYILYIHPKTGRETTGWIKVDRLQPTGTGIGPKPE
jgi:hypothetical protein